MISRSVNLGGLPVPQTLVTSWAILLLLIAAGGMVLFSFRRSSVERPRPLAVTAIMLVRSLDQMVETTMGRENIWYAPIAGSILAFLLPANLTGLVGVDPPASDILTPVALVTVVFIILHARGIARKGPLRYLRRFAEPAAFMIPLNLIGEISTPLSMSMRLFGNMLAGTFIMSMLYRVAPPVVPVVPHLFFDVFDGGIQAYIFVMLAMTFTAAALE